MRVLKGLLLVTILSSTSLSAQDDKKVDDLVFLFVDGKYDKLIYKGQSVMENDKYRKHPLPYIYVSMSYYEMSKQPGKFSVGEKDSEFPKPLKEAQKYLYKFMKADKKAPKYYDQSWYDEFKDYYINLADTSNKLAQYLFMNDQYRKAASVYKSAVKAIPNDPVLKLWLGVSYLKAKNTYEGKLALENAMKSIDEKFVPSKATSAVLPHGLLLAEELMRTNEMYEQADKAKNLIEVFKKYDPDELDKQKLEERKEEAKKDDRVMRKFYSDEDEKKGENIIIKDGYGSDGNGTKTDEEKLDELERQQTEVEE